MKAIRDSSDDARRLDIGCAANVGAFRTIVGDENEIEIDRWNDPAGTLVWFVTRLLAMLQAMATVPPIDTAQWADVALSEGLADLTAGDD